MGYKWMVDTADTGHRRGNHHAIPYKYDKKRPPEFTAVAASICEMRIPYIFMWRKNTLRRMISNAANQHTTKRAIRKNIDPHAHAARPTNYDPRVQAHLGDDRQLQRGLPRAQGHAA